MEESLQQRCRTCLKSGVPLVSVLDQSSACTVAEMLIKCTNVDQSSTCTVAEMLAKCTTVTITDNDTFPKKLCLSCVIEIKRSYFFKIKCESSQEILQQYAQFRAVTEESATSRTEQSQEQLSEGSKKVVSGTDMDGLTIIQALEMETQNKQNVVYKDLAEILGDEEIRVPEEPVQNDNVPMEIFKGDVLDEQRHESGPDHDLEAIRQDGNDNDDDMGESEHQQIVILYCEKCSNTFESMEEFDAHSVDCGKVQMVNSEIINNTKGKCSHCSHYFVNLEKHILKWHPNCSSQRVTWTTENDPSRSQESDNKDDCPKSDNEDEEDSLMRQVIQQYSLLTDHPKSLPTAFTCSRCGIGFAKNSSLYVHMRINKCTTPPFTCKICAKVFVGEKYLIEHLNAHENAFRCLRCESSFSSEKELHEHTMNRHKGVLKNECRLCGKVFTMLSTLEAHFRIHYGATPFICSICCKECFKATNLLQHVMLHKNHKSFECNQCGSFVSKEELIAHVRNHTGDLPYVCNICYSAFKAVSRLTKHRRIHTGERPYACDLCPNRFVDSSTLENHQRSHPYICSICGYGFLGLIGLQAHLKLHVKEKQAQTVAVKEITKYEEKEDKDQEIIEIEDEDDENDMEIKVEDDKNDIEIKIEDDDL